MTITAPLIREHSVRVATTTYGVYGAAETHQTYNGREIATT